MIEDGVRIIGNVTIGENPSICWPSEINGKGASITIGDGFDCAAYVTVHCSDSHARCLGRSDEIERLPIIIGARVFVGTGAVILGGCVIGDDCVIGAGVVLKKAQIPPRSRVTAPPPIIECGYYDRPKLERLLL